MTEERARRAVEAVWRSESGRIVAALTRQTGDFGWAEDLAQDALLEALAAWPTAGIPDNPGAWLMSVAKRRAIDGWRRRERLAAREAVLGSDAILFEREDAVPSLGDPDRIDDDVLRLVFIACHPVITAQARLALTLR
ncbi:MAG: sigma factor, partial [Microbacterium pygmaeum]